MIFPHLALPTTRPIPTLGGGTVRHRPVIYVRVFGPTGSRLVDACIDSASDDVIFPQSLARQLGINLSAAAQGQAAPVAGVPVSYPVAPAQLRLMDGGEQ